MGADAMSIRVLVLAVVLGVFMSTGAAAGVGNPYVGSVIGANSEDASLFILPDGSGPSFMEAVGYGGHTIDARIIVSLVDEYFDPIPYFPREDIWLAPEVGGVFFCNHISNGGFYCDAATDEYGLAYFILPLAGGGWSIWPPYVYLNGERAVHPTGMTHPPVSMRFNSADINADGRVDLIDISRFAYDYLFGYHYRCDFHWDGVLNVADVALLASGVGANCE